MKIKKSVKEYKEAKRIICDIPNYMDYQPTKEQREALDLVINLLNDAIEEATVSCNDCKHYEETDHEIKLGICKLLRCGHVCAEDDCDNGERRDEL